MAIDNEAIQDFIEAIKPTPVDTNSTYSAVVSRIDDEGTVWVYLAGSNKDTPTANTSAEVEVGDSVNVEWRHNKLYIAGNYSNPSAGAIRVNAVEIAAQVANSAAQSAVADAGVAREAASSAQTSATEAKTIAEGVEDIAKDAQESADSAKKSADTAFTQLSIVEDIVGVLDLIAKNGEYDLTNDPEADPNKWYFTRSGSGTEEDPYVHNVTEVATIYALTEDSDIDPNKTYYTRSGTAPDYVYTPVNNPVVEDIGTYYEAHRNPHAQGLYELTDIKKSIENYVSSHLVLDPKGLWLRPNDGSTQIHISTVTGDEGVIIYGPDGNILAKYGSTAIIGDTKGFHLEIGATTDDNAEIGFYLGEQRVAYLNSAELYVQNSLSFGNFAFIQRRNGHFTLKIID